VTEVFPPDGAQDVIDRLNSVLTQTGPDIVVVRRVIDGEERWMRSAGVRLRDGVAVTFRDITAERDAERTLRETEAQLRVLMNALPQLLWGSRADGWCDYFSPQWLAFAGGEDVIFVVLAQEAALFRDRALILGFGLGHGGAGQQPHEHGAHH